MSKKNKYTDSCRGGFGRYVLTVCMAACVAGPLSAVRLPAVVPDNVRMEWVDSTRLKLRYAVDAGDVKIKTDYRLVVVPCLVSADGRYERPLDPVELAGKRNRRYFDRKVALEGGERYPVYNVTDTVRVEREVDVEPWMREAELQLVMRRDLENCCGVTTLEELPAGRTKWFAPVFTTVTPWISVAERLAEHEPILAPMAGFEPFNTNQPMRKMKDAYYVYFPISKSVLREDFRNNAVTLNRVLDIITQIEADTLSRVTKIRIVGMASPDGPQALNERLARNRAQVLRDYLVEHDIVLPDSVYEVIGGGEAWADLLDLIEESDLEKKAELVDIIRNTPNLNRREWLLRRHDGGRSFDRLRKGMLDEQRNSGYTQIYFEAVPDEPARRINKAVELMRAGQAHEALAQVEDLNDNRKWNVLGSALYLCGHRQEALDCFRRAVTCGDKSAERNVRELERVLELERQQGL